MSSSNTDINSVLFEVADGPLYFQRSRSDQQGAEQGDLFDKGGTAEFVKLPKFRAILDVERNHVFSVVTDDYRLITNAEAIELGKQCFAEIFHSKLGEGLKVFNIVMPKTRSFCHIDFVHNDFKFEPFAKDTWSPFLRVTISYNRLRLLRFDLGFCRWICTNGMIFGGKSITFRYNHTYSSLGRTVEFKSNIGDIRKIEAEFIEKLHNLKRFYVPKEAVLGMCCLAFQIKVEKYDISKERRVEQLKIFRETIGALTDKYFAELGPTGYAALNIITDFASRPTSFIPSAGVIDRLQRQSASWTEDFIMKIKDERFDFDVYLTDYKETTQLINSL